MGVRGQHVLSALWADVVWVFTLGVTAFCQQCCRVGKMAGVTGWGTHVDLHALWVHTRRVSGRGSKVVGLTTVGATSGVGCGRGVVGLELLRMRKKTELARSHATAFWCLSVRLSHMHGHQTWRVLAATTNGYPNTTHNMVQFSTC